MRYNGYKKLAAAILFITCMEILLCSASIIPIVSSMNNNSTIEVVSSMNSDNSTIEVVSSMNNNSTIEATFEDKNISNQHFGRYIFRYRLFGPIYHLSIDGDDYEFESNNLRGLKIDLLRNCKTRTTVLF